MIFAKEVIACTTRQIKAKNCDAGEQRESMWNESAPVFLCAKRKEIGAWRKVYLLVKHNVRPYRDAVGSRKGFVLPDGSQRTSKGREPSSMRLSPYF